MSADWLAQLGGQCDFSREELLNMVANLYRKNMKLEDRIDTLEQENSQLRQQMNRGTTSGKHRNEKKEAGCPAKEITLAIFRSNLKDAFKPKAERIIKWIRGKIAQLNDDPSYCATITNQGRMVAPLYVAIRAGVFTSRDSNDARPDMKGSPLERFFALPDGSYRKYSRYGSFRPGAIQSLTESFQNDVLMSA